MERAFGVDLCQQPLRSGCTTCSIPDIGFEVELSTMNGRRLFSRVVQLFDYQRRCSRRAIHTVDARMTKAPSKVVWLGTSENTNQPINDAQIKSRKRKDCVAEMSATRNPRVRQ